MLTNRLTVRMCHTLIWFGAQLVPKELRDDWLTEWRAELAHALAGSEKNDGNRKLTNVGLLRRCTCSLGDAVSVRRLANWAAKGHSASRTPRHSAAFHDIVQDVRPALRSLRKTPAFALTALFTVALGIGATTAVFSVIQAALLAPLPHEDGERLGVIWETDRRYTPPATTVNVTPGNFADWRTQARSFEGLAAYSIGRGTVTGEGEPDMVVRAWVTSDFLPLLRGRAALGRVFTAGDDSPDANPVVLLSHGFWRSRFGGSVDVLGRSLALNGNDFEIVGVLQPDVDFLARGIQVWTPYLLPQSELGDRRQHYLNVLARLRPGVSWEEAQAEMDAIADRIRLEYPEWMTQRGVNVVPLRDQMLGSARLTLQVLFGAVLVVLLIAAVNVANLLMVRGSARRQEFAVRSALGAGRNRLIRQFLTESLTLALLGGTLGVCAAAVSTDALFALAPGSIQRAAKVGVDLHVLGFAIALSVMTGVLFGLIPAVQYSRVTGNRNLTGAGRWGGHSEKNRARQVLVIGELALSMMLLVGAGLLTQTFWRLASVDPGFASEHILTASMRLPQREYPDVARATAFYDGLLERVRALPQVSSAGLTRFLPLSDGPWTFSMEVDGFPTPPEDERQNYAYQPVSTGYFRTAGIALLRGRDFSAADNADAVPVVIINEAMKRLFWPDSDPIGAHLRFDRDSENPSWRQIVGVVEDVRHDGLRREARPTVYGPQHQAAAYLLDRMRLVVSTSSDPLLIARDVRRIVYGLDRNLVVFDIRTMQQIVENSVSQPKFAMLLVLGFAGVAAVLALVGVYGVISYTVSQRLPELGLRIALGAQANRIGGLVLSQGMAVAGLGIGIGVFGALLSTRLLESLLYDISATDPRTYLVLALGFAIAAAAACYLPARKAASADPLEVMRGGE